MDMTIGKFAKAGNVGVETIRFYQRKGLLATPRTPQGVRRYDTGDLRRLKFIRQAQTAGFTLEEIRHLLDLDEGEDRQSARALAKTRLEALDARIEELQRARESPDQIGRRVRIRQDGSMPHPAFLRRLRTNGEGGPPQGELHAIG